MNSEHSPRTGKKSIAVFHLVYLFVGASLTLLGCDSGILTDSLFEDSEAGLVGVEVSTTALSDVDNDGSLDLLITGWNGRTDVARLYLGDGRGGFRSADAGLAGVSLGSTSIADLNGDGHQDLLITGMASSDTPTSTVYFGNGRGGFTEANAGLTGLALSSSSVADVNDDGALDLLLTGLDSTETQRSILYLGNGDGAFTKADADLLGVEQSSTSIADLNGDGTLDLVITGFDTTDTPTSKLYLGKGNGQFTEANVGFLNVAKGATSIGDVDGNGTKDVLITGWNDSTEVSTLYLGDGQGNFEVADANLQGVEKSSTAMGDVNEDGQLDLLITGSRRSERTTTLYLGDQGRTFTKADTDFPNLALGSTSLGDLNGDQTLDVVLTGQTAQNSPSVSLHLGYGDGTFTEVTSVLTSSVSGQSPKWSPDGWSNDERRLRIATARTETARKYRRLRHSPGPGFPIRSQTPRSNPDANLPRHTLTASPWFTPVARRSIE